MRSTRSLCAAAVLAFSIAQSARAVTFTRIAGTGDPVPGAGGDLFLEVHGAQLAGDWVVARGYSASESGIFVWHGGDAYRVLVTTTDLPGIPPEAELNIANPAYYDIDGTGRVAVAISWFLPDHPDPASTVAAGVWTWKDGQFESLVQSGMTVDRSDQPFIAAVQVASETDEAVFRTVEGVPEDFDYAIYRWSAADGVRRIAGPGFSVLAWPKPGASEGVAFNGSSTSGVRGIWATPTDGSDLTLELDLDSQFPLGPEGSSWHQITSGSSAHPLAGWPLTLAARSSVDFDRQGIFRLTGGGTSEILFDSAELDPTSGLPHAGIYPAGIAGSGENVAFMLDDPTQQSTLGRRLIVRDGDGMYHLMAAEGREFEGQDVQLLEFLHGGMDGNRFAFNAVQPTDRAVWLADFGTPAPSALEIPAVRSAGLLVLALALAFLGVGRLGGRGV